MTLKFPLKNKNKNKKKEPRRVENKFFSPTAAYSLIFDKSKAARDYAALITKFNIIARYCKNVQDKPDSQ